jgi:hypothetical protein
MVLAIGAVKRASAEEDHPGTLLARHRGFFTPMQPRPGDPNLIRFSTPSPLTFGAVNSALVGAKHAMLVRKQHRRVNHEPDCTPARKKMLPVIGIYIIDKQYYHTVFGLFYLIPLSSY